MIHTDNGSTFILTIVPATILISFILFYWVKFFTAKFKKVTEMDFERNNDEMTERSQGEGN